MDSTGVMPLPAAIRTWCPGRDRSGVNVPDGAWTSMTSPGRTSWTSQPDTAPPGHFPHADPGRVALRGRRSSRSAAPAPRRTVRDWPGAKPEPLRHAGRHAEGQRGGVIGQRVDTRTTVSG